MDLEDVLEEFHADGVPLILPVKVWQQNAKLQRSQKAENCVAESYFSYFHQIWDPFTYRLFRVYVFTVATAYTLRDDIGKIDKAKRPQVLEKTLRHSRRFGNKFNVHGQQVVYKPDVNKQAIPTGGDVWMHRVRFSRA